MQKSFLVHRHEPDLAHGHYLPFLVYSDKQWILTFNIQASLDTSPLEYLNVPNPHALLGKVTSSYSRVEYAHMTSPPKRCTSVHHCDFLHRHQGNPPLPPTSVFCSPGRSAETRGVHRGLSALHLIGDIPPHNLAASESSDNQQMQFEQGQCEVPPGPLQPADPHMLWGHTQYSRKAP